MADKYNQPRIRIYKWVYDRQKKMKTSSASSSNGSEKTPESINHSSQRRHPVEISSNADVTKRVRDGIPENFEALKYSVKAQTSIGAEETVSDLASNQMPSQVFENSFANGNSNDTYFAKLDKKINKNHDNQDKD